MRAARPTRMRIAKRSVSIGLRERSCLATTQQENKTTSTNLARLVVLAATKEVKKCF